LFDFIDKTFNQMAVLDKDAGRIFFPFARCNDALESQL